MRLAKSYSHFLYIRLLMSVPQAGSLCLFDPNKTLQTENSIFCHCMKVFTGALMHQSNNNPFCTAYSFNLDLDDIREELLALGIDDEEEAAPLAADVAKVRFFFTGPRQTDRAVEPNEREANV